MADLVRSRTVGVRPGGGYDSLGKESVWFPSHKKTPPGIPTGQDCGRASVHKMTYPNLKKFIFIIKSKNFTTMSWIIVIFTYICRVTRFKLFAHNY